MEDYSFWADLLASYRASPDIVKALWLLVPLLVAAGFFVLAAGAALRLTERRGERRPQSRAEERKHPTDREWLAAAAQRPLIEHGRVDEPIRRP